MSAHTDYHFTPEAKRLLVDAVRQWGRLSLAARAIAVEPAMVAAMLRRDPDLNAEIQAAIEEHKDLLYGETVQRATRGKSDALLGKLLEAQMPALFDPKARNAHIAARGKPTGVRLRQFSAAEDGTVEDVTDKETPPASPAEPLALPWAPRIF